MQNLCFAQDIGAIDFSVLKAEQQAFLFSEF